MVLYKYLCPNVIRIIRKLILSEDDLLRYMKIFDYEINKGMCDETSEEANVKSIITHVNKLPTGDGRLLFTFEKV